MNRRYPKTSLTLLTVLLGLVVVAVGYYLFLQKLQTTPSAQLSRANIASSTQYLAKYIQVGTPGFFPFPGQSSPTTTGEDIPLLLNPFPKEDSFTARVEIDDPNSSYSDAGWYAEFAARLGANSSRIIRVSVLGIQSNSLQPSVLVGRELYIIGNSAAVKSFTMAKGSIEIMDIYSCQVAAPWYFFCADAITTPQHLTSLLQPYITWNQPYHDQSYPPESQLYNADTTLVGVDWDQAAGTLKLHFIVSASSRGGFCPYPWMGIVPNEYGYIIPETQHYVTSYCTSGGLMPIEIDFDDIPPSQEISVVSSDLDHNYQEAAAFVISASGTSVSAQLEPMLKSDID